MFFSIGINYFDGFIVVRINYIVWFDGIGIYVVVSGRYDID